MCSSAANPCPTRPTRTFAITNPLRVPCVLCVSALNGSAVTPDRRGTIYRAPTQHRLSKERREIDAAALFRGDVGGVEDDHHFLGQLDARHGCPVLADRVDVVRDLLRIALHTVLVRRGLGPAGLGLDLLGD